MLGCRMWCWSAAWSMLARPLHLLQRNLLQQPASIGLHATVRSELSRLGLARRPSGSRLRRFPACELCVELVGCGPYISRGGAHTRATSALDPCLASISMSHVIRNFSAHQSPQMQRALLHSAGWPKQDVVERYLSLSLSRGSMCVVCTATATYRNLPVRGTSHGCQRAGARAAAKWASRSGREKVHPTKHRGTAERERSTAPELH